MIIRNLEQLERNNKQILQATIVWENADFQPDTYYFSVDKRYGELLGNPADAFLCGSILPGYIHGEERVMVEGDVCPYLVDNLREALFWISAWYPQYSRTESIQIDAGFRSTVNKAVGSALFYSGGVDAAFSLAHNRDHIPLDHPATISRLILVRGFDIGGKKIEKENPAAIEAFARATDQAMIAAQGYDAELITLTTNIRHLDDRSGIWGEIYVAGALSACAHALGNAANLFYISAAGEPLGESGDMSHYGTHPLLDPCYSGSAVQIKHYLSHYDSRLDRLRAISNHPILFDSLRVCFNPPADKLNCQQCEKCVRTRLQLEIIGKLDACSSLDNGITETEVERGVITCDSVLCMYQEILDYMQKSSHPFQALIEKKIANYKRYKKWKEGKTWKRRAINLIRSTLNR